MPMVRKAGAGPIQAIAPSIQLRPLFSHANTVKAKRIAPKPSRKCRNNHEQSCSSNPSKACA